ncbi:hypothetical protein HanPSC8_Chr08g0330951 [Helianthus annuus]|nr:hypothetical protein HanPSC8_Chr08g0330951 [Helianthus annuus]
MNRIRRSLSPSLICCISHIVGGLQSKSQNSRTHKDSQKDYWINSQIPAFRIRQSAPAVRLLSSAIADLQE